MSESKKISSLQELSQEEVKDALISGLRSRPNSTSIYGGKGLTADELKKQYDKYPEKLRVKLNELIKVLQERFSVDENGITPVANDIYVKIAGDTIATLSSAIVGLDRTDREMSFDISQLSVKADNALQTAERASTVANEAHSFAEGAMSLSGVALGIANESKEIANDAYSYARTADQNSYQAQSLAENAENSSKNALSIAKEARKESEDAIKIADEAIDIANRASEGIGFKTRAEMYAYINSMSWFKDYHFDRHAIIPKGSYVVVSIDFETKEYVNSYGEIEYVTPTSVDIFWDKRYENNGSVVVKSNRVYTVFKILDDIAFNDIFYQGFYTYNNAVDDRIYFNSNERIVITDKENPTYQEYGSYKIPYGTHMGIEEEGVPDYWWAGIRAVESEAKVNLKNYADKDFVAENYVKKETGNKMGVYVHDYDGTTGKYVDRILKYSSGAGPNAWYFVQRDGDGLIQTASPIKDLHVANKIYVDKSLTEVKNGLQSILDAINNMM